MILDEAKLKQDIDYVMGPWLDGLSKQDLLDLSGYVKEKQHFSKIINEVASELASEGYFERFKAPAFPEQNRRSTDNSKK